MITAAICNFKGGVTKTTTTVNVAVALSRMGYATMAVDLDRTQTDISHWDGNMGDVVARATTPGRLPRLVETAAKKPFDFMIIDTPPALQKEAASALRAADLVIVPVAPQILDSRGLSRFVAVIDAARKDRQSRGVGGLQTMILPVRVNPKNERAAAIIEEFHAAFQGRPDVYLWPTPVPVSETVIEANDYAQPVVTFAPRTAAARVYISLAEHIAARYGENHGQS
jgi:cellulose biosynthesis protein BcsQ